MRHVLYAVLLALATVTSASAGWTVFDLPVGTACDGAGGGGW
jgi:hypothetical protein